ncbi:hypothetical protein DFH11DRAFT_1624651 [Phellopilus nigrolimitatus]|nr:hypothetical protein DFH11DRAFT_1624651 [Phellopilus nigrolimitatus]
MLVALMKPIDGLERERSFSFQICVPKTTADYVILLRYSNHRWPTRRTWSWTYRKMIVSTRAKPPTGYTPPTTHMTNGLRETCEFTAFRCDGLAGGVSLRTEQRVAAKGCCNDMHSCEVRAGDIGCRTLGPIRSRGRAKYQRCDDDFQRPARVSRLRDVDMFDLDVKIMSMGICGSKTSIASRLLWYLTLADAYRTYISRRHV